MKIELATEPTKKDLETISQGIQSYNKAHMPDEVVFEPDTRFAVFVRNENNEVVGGVRATAFWNYCIVELLWLSEETRGSGIGSKLMAQVESYAKSKGFQYIRAETLDFQAKGFYEKLGYTVFGQLPDCPKGHITYCLAKGL